VGKGVSMWFRISVGRSRRWGVDMVGVILPDTVGVEAK